MKQILKSLYKLVFNQKPIQTLSDPYLPWLTSANAGFLHHGNIFALDFAISRLTSENPILEIGAFCGLSTNAITYLLSKYSKNNILISSDPWLFENGYEENSMLPGTSIPFIEYRTHIMNSFRANVAFFSKPLPHPVELTSDAFFQLWHDEAVVHDLFNRPVTFGGPIALAYIDGNHTYEYSKRDFSNVDQFLEPGGFVLLDDTFRGSNFGCARLIQEILHNPNYTLVLENPNFLFQKVCRI